jgi:hypothetical protein
MYTLSRLKEGPFMEKNEQERNDQCKACNESRHQECEVKGCNCECYGLGTTCPDWVGSKN